MDTYGELRKRGFEVIKYYKFVRGLDSTDEDLIKILKAHCFTMLYNLIESVATNAFEEVYDACGQHTFDDLRSEVKMIVLKNVQGRNARDLVGVLNSLSGDIVLASFKKDELFSGNLDARKLRDTMSEYGIDRRSDYKNDGMHVIKINRNDLGHGVKSFVECGRDYTIEDLGEYIFSTIRFLRRFLSDVERYISAREYLMPTAS
ncbi:MAE_28990/MAE_18760 family HEPN-like nuclease [Deinococcus aluminii]|uniref:MAE_28990/MAE_18760 family HEPN-like nuclease n=1 Tax=Deinococcus aluminii TaxID=1656885 RepID=UPI0031E896A3